MLCSLISPQLHELTYSDATKGCVVVALVTREPNKTKLRNPKLA